MAEAPSVPNYCVGNEYLRQGKTALLFRTASGRLLPAIERLRLCQSATTPNLHCRVFARLHQYRRQKLFFLYM